MTFVQGREYFLGLTDGEHDYYYNARVILADGAPLRALHPGTPIYYLGALILAIVGDGQDNTQAFFNIGYVVGFLSIAAAMLFFARTALRGVGFGWAILIFATIAVWPPAVTYLNYFTGDIFILAATVVVLGMFWRLLGTSELGNRQLAIFGVLLGIAMAIKSNFLLIAVPISVSMAVHFLRMAGGDAWTTRLREVVSRLFVVVGFTFLAFVVSIAPVLPQTHTLIRKLKNKAGGSESFVSNLFDQLGSLFQIAPIFSLGLLAATVFAVIIGVIWLKTDSPWKRVNWMRQEQAQHDLVATVIFLAVGGLVLVFSIVGQLHATLDGIDSDPGINSRPITPIAMFLPLALLSLRELWRHSEHTRSWFSVQPGLVNLLVIPVAVLAITWTFVDYVRFRSDVFGNMRVDLAARTESLDALRGDGRVAIWAWGEGMGEPTFHFWGNYFYAYDRFDSEVLAANPNFTFIRLHFAELLETGREAGLTSPSIAALREMIEPRVLSSNPLKRAFQQWGDRFPYPDRTTELITGENVEEITAIVLIGDELSISGVDPVESLMSLLPDRFGATEYSIIEVGEEKWTVFSIGR